MREIFILDHLVYVRDDLFHVSRSSVKIEYELKTGSSEENCSKYKLTQLYIWAFPPVAGPLFCRCRKRRGLSQFCWCYHQYLL